jgi:hypothetical protein
LEAPRLPSIIETDTTFLPRLIGQPSKQGWKRPDTETISIASIVKKVETFLGSEYRPVLKESLIARKIPNEVELLETVTEILNGISDVELQRVSRNWKNVLKG